MSDDLLGLAGESEPRVFDGFFYNAGLELEMKREMMLVVALGALASLGGCSVVLGLDEYKPAEKGTACSPGTQLKCLYAGPATTEDVGLCRAGLQTCLPDGTGYGPCEGEVLPAAAEDCSTPGDDDCNGSMNEGCTCQPQSMMACYPGPAGTQDIGACKGGMQACAADGMGYGACMGAVIPAVEDCATPTDEDCNGKAFDDAAAGCVCEPGMPTACYTGAAGTLGVGQCKAGMGTCTTDGKGFMDCMGETTPAAVDDCNVAGDEDCSGSGCADHRFSTAFGDLADQYVNSTATDPMGNAILVGGFYGAIQIDANAPVLSAVGSTDAYVAKFDGNGKHLWSKRFGDASEQTATGVATDAQGNIFVTGYFTGTIDFGNGTPLSDLKYDSFVVKFDPDGKVLWAKQYGGGNNDLFWAIAVDTQGSAIVTGWNEGGIAGRDMWIAKYDSAGVTQWFKLISPGYDQLGIAVVTDSSNAIFVTGRFAGTMTLGNDTLVSTANSDDIFLTKLDSAGNFSWAKRFGDAAVQSADGITIDPGGNVIVAGWNAGVVNFGGSTLTSAGGDDVVVAKFNSAGLHIASKQYGDAMGQRGHRVASDSAGNIILTGEFAGTVNFGGTQWVSAGGTDMFLAKFDGNLNHRWSKRFGTGGTPQVGYCVAIGTNDRIFLAGNARGNIDFGGGTCSAGGSVEVFFAGFEP